MKRIARALGFVVLLFLTELTGVFALDVFSDPETKIPYCAPGSNCGLEAGVELTKKGVSDVITEGTFSSVIQDVVVYFLGFITLIAIIYIFYAGFRILTSSGEEEVIKKSKSTIIYVIVGILVIWFAWTIANFAIGIGTGGNQKGGNSTQISEKIYTINKYEGTLSYLWNNTEHKLTL